MNKIIIGVVITVIVLGGVGIYVFSPSEEYANVPPSTNQPVVMKAFSMDEIREHSSSESCYTAIRGNVYDVTGFISKHPGGSDAVLKTCGNDGTDLFVGKHGGKEKMESVLETMKIGTVTQ